MGGLMMGSGRQDNVAVFRSTIQHMPENGHIAAQNDSGTLLELHLFHIVGEVAAGHALVNVFIFSGCLDKPFDFGLNIVFGFNLPLFDEVQVNVFKSRFITFDHICGNGDPKLFLGFHYGNPEFPFC